MRDGWRKIFLKNAKVIAICLGSLFTFHLSRFLVCCWVKVSLLWGRTAHSLSSVPSGPDRDSWHWWHWHSRGSVLLSIIRQDQADRPTPAAPGNTKLSSGSRRRSEPFMCCKLFENEKKEVFMQLGPMLFRGFVKWWRIEWLDCSLHYSPSLLTAMSQ